jgi:hypothetical protein
MADGDTPRQLARALGRPSEKVRLAAVAEIAPFLTDRRERAAASSILTEAANDPDQMPSIRAAASSALAGATPP